MVPMLLPFPLLVPPTNVGGVGGEYDTLEMSCLLK